MKEKESLLKAKEETRAGRIMFCPKCGLYQNHWFLVLDDKLSEQSVGYVCKACTSVTAALTRSRGTGKVTKKYFAPGFRAT